MSNIRSFPQTDERNRIKSVCDCLCACLLHTGCVLFHEIEFPVSHLGQGPKQFINLAHLQFLSVSRYASLSGLVWPVSFGFLRIEIENNKLFLQMRLMFFVLFSAPCLVSHAPPACSRTTSAICCQTLFLIIRGKRFAQIRMTFF